MAGHDDSIHQRISSNDEYLVMVDIPREYLIKNINRLRKALKSNTQIHAMELNISVRVNPRSLKALFEALGDHPSIRTLKLYGHALGLNHSCCVALSVLIKKTHTIQNLILTGTSIGNNPENIRCIASALSANTTITMLDLSSNNLSNPIILTHLLEMLRANNTIRTLKLKYSLATRNTIRNGVSDVSRFISEILRCNTSIRRLDLSDNALGYLSSHFETFSNALTTNSTLEILSLSRNSLGKNTNIMRYLSEALENHKSVRELDISWNNILSKPANMKYLAKIMNCETVCSLDLHGNMLAAKPECMRDFSDLLRKTGTLRELCLQRNGFGNMSTGLLSYFIDSLASNNSIEFVRLDQNNLHVLEETLGYDHEIKQTLELLEMNGSIQNVVVDENRSKIYEKLFEIAQRNRINNKTRCASLFGLLLPTLRNYEV